MSSNRNKFLRATLLFFLILPLISCRYIYFQLNNYNKIYLQKIKSQDFFFQNLIEDYFPNHIYTSFKLGYPYQEVKSWIDTDEYGYYLMQDTCILDSPFNLSLSENYQNTNITKLKKLYYKDYGSAFYLNESIILKNNVGHSDNEILMNSFPFMFMPDPQNDKYFKDKHKNFEFTGNSCATLGFRATPNNRDLTTKNFIQQLKYEDLIDSYSFFFEYDNKGEETSLIVGAYPDEVYPDRYEFQYLETTYVENYNRLKIQWGIRFDEVETGEGEEKKNFIYKNAGFHHNLNGILGVMDYKNWIEKYYFSKLLGEENERICMEEFFGQYSGFVCNKSKFTQEDKEKFPEIRLVKKDLKKTFILGYEDVFVTIGNKVFFIIVFHKTYTDIWELGKPFFKKYFFVYNFDSKLVGYYTKVNPPKTREKRFVEEHLISLVFIIGILGIVCGILCFLLGKKIYEKKKGLIKAIELDQDSNYEYNYINFENESENGGENKGKIICDDNNYKHN